MAEGYRHLTHLLGYGLDLYVEGDPERPAFTPLASPTRKILGDNVDSRYHFAPLRGDRAYRIRGVRGNGVYLAFCVYGGKPDGEWSERVVANVSQRDLELAPDGGFDLVLSPERPDGGQWVKLEPDAVCVISREYFADPRAARPARFTIAALGRSATGGTGAGGGGTRTPSAGPPARARSDSPARGAWSRRSCSRSRGR